MKIEPKAFIAIERSMSAAMKAEWDRLATSIVAQIRSAVTGKDWAKAQSLAGRLVMEGVVKTVRPRLEELAVSALLFGAHRVTGDVRETHYAKGTPIPHELQLALDQLGRQVEQDAADYVRKAVMTAIEDAKRADPTAHIQKHDIYAEPDKRPDAQTAEEYPPEPDLTGEEQRRQEALYGRAGWQQKDDISDAQLAETGGLLEPEQGGPKKRKKKQFVTKTEGPKTLYVNRPLLNADELIAWANAEGFKFVQLPGDMHVTECYSKQPFDWDELEPNLDNVTVVGGARSIHQFGDAVVLVFDSELLAEEHAEFMAAGASYDFPEYRSHVTISWKGAPRAVEEVKPFEGNLQFGPQEFAPINKDWQQDHLEIELRKAEKSLADKINDAVMNGGQVASDLGAQLTTSRLVTLGFLSQARANSVRKYRVDEVLDDRTCPICERMNGKVFSVDQQYGRVMQALGASDPQALRDIAPWPDLAEIEGMSNDELQTSGYGAPPYHPGCRGMLSLVGDEEPASISLPQLEAAAPDIVVNDALTSLTIPGEVEESLGFSDEEKQEIAWSRFDVTDPTEFAKVNAAYEGGDYALAQSLIDEWKRKHVAKGADSIPPSDDEGFEGPNAPRKKRRAQMPAGKETDYSDISSDSSSIAFDNDGVAGVYVMNDLTAPIDRV